MIWSDNAAAVLGIADIGAVANGRSFAQLAKGENGQSRYDAIVHATQGDTGGGIAYQMQYTFRRDPTAEPMWLEDTGRWFAGPDGKPLRAHGLVRVITARHERDRQLVQLAHYDPLTGEMNRACLTEVLGATLDEAVRFRSSCGFMLAAIDNLGRLNESYGFEVAEQVIADLAKRIRARLRGKDHLGRFSGNKFGVILTSCTPDELELAAERLLTSVREEPMLTTAGPVRGDREHRRRHRAAPRPHRS